MYRLARQPQPARPSVLLAALLSTLGSTFLPSILSALPGTARAETATMLAPVEVYGQGEFRQVHTWRPSAEAPVPPGESPLRTLNQLTGANVQTADPQGAYEWAVRISVRGFSAAQLGFTLDDIPLGDLYYSTLNGLYISRALISENLASMRISQGSGALDTASGSNLGGTLQFYSQDPGESPGARFGQTFGSSASQRTMLRLDSGRLENDGKFYIAAAQQGNDLWKGSGHQRQDQFNFKYTQPLATQRLSAYFNHAERQEMDYQDMTRSWIRQLGYRWSNYWPNLNAAIANASATDVPVGATQAVDNPVDAAYYAASGVRRDHLGYLTLEGSLSPASEWKGSVYAHTYQGASIWYTPYKATPGPEGTPLSERVLAYDSQRLGALATLSWTHGAHRFSNGLWYEHNDARQKRLFFPVYRSGPLYSPYELPDAGSAFLTQWAYAFSTDTVQYHAQDVWQIDRRLSLLAGFKSTYNRTEGKPTVDQLGGLPLPHGSLTAVGAFLPQIGLKYALGPREEIFLDAARSLRNYPLGGYGLGLSPWAVRNQAAFDLARARLAPETAWTYEAGYRFGDTLPGPLLRGYQGVLSAYHVDFSNRLLNVAPGGSLIAATSNAAVLSNVGGVTMNGVELSGTLTLGRSLRWQQALSYNRATYDDDYEHGGQRIATAGKTVVDAPRWIYKNQLAYRQGPYAAHLQADYLSSRYYTYTNDQSVPGRWLFNLGASRALGRPAPLTEATLQLDVLNVFNEKYVSTVGTSGYTASGDYQTLQVGPPRQIFLTLQLRL